MEKLIDWIQIALIGLMTMLCALLGFVLLPFGQRNALYWASQVWSRSLFLICGVELFVEGTHHLDARIPRIYVSNHQSNMDIPLLFAALPVALFFIAKQELKKIPFMGWYMAAVGMIFIDRSDRDKAFKSLKKAGNEIKRGKSVVSFPEGTRSTTGDVGLFKRGTFVLALENNIEVVPVAIIGAERIIPPKKFEIYPGKARVVIGAPLSPEEWKHQGVEAFANRCRDAVLELKSSQPALV